MSSTEWHVYAHYHLGFMAHLCVTVKTKSIGQSKYIKAEPINLGAN